MPGGRKEKKKEKKSLLRFAMRRTKRWENEIPKVVNIFIQFKERISSFSYTSVILNYKRV